jgi:diguanylate cyclase (GGDEF)-like protein
MSGNPIVLSDESRAVSLESGVSYLIDADASMGPMEAYRRRASGEPLQGRSVQIPRDGVMWVYLDIVNRGATARWYVENQVNVEELALFLLEDGSWTIHQRTGNLVPFSQREIRTRRPTVAVDLPQDSTVPVLLRVSDYQSSNVRLRLFPHQQFWQHVQDDTLVVALAFGFFAALIIYNLLVFVTARERLYLVYALYMVAFFFNQLAQERLFSQYLQPNQPYGFFWFVLFSAATAALGVEFFRLFVDTRKNTPRLDAAARAVQVVSASIGLSAFFSAGPASADLINVVALVAMAVILWVLIVRIAAGDRLALVCLLGSIVYLLGTATEIVSALVEIQITPFVVHGQLFGALAQVLFLGFAVGRRTAETRERLLQIQTNYRTELEQEVAERTRDLKAVTEQLHRQAVTDPLTGLHNRAELAKRAVELDTFLARQDVDHPPFVLSVAYLDLDNFKFVNDTYGHRYGDDLLRTTAHILRENTRGYDLVFRLGGDEFAVVMPKTEKHEAAVIVDRIRTAFTSRMSTEKGVSMSAGLATTRGRRGVTVEQLIELADQALLSAKAGGKDQLVSAEV